MSAGRVGRGGGPEDHRLPRLITMTTGLSNLTENPTNPTTDGIFGISKPFLLVGFAFGTRRSAPLTRRKTVLFVGFSSRVFQHPRLPYANDAFKCPVLGRSWFPASGSSGS